MAIASKSCQAPLISSGKPYTLRRYIIPFICLIILLAACDRQAKGVQGYLDEVIILLRKDNFNYNKDEVIKMLSEGLEEYPDDIRLLTARSNVYCDHGLVTECRADLMSILKQDPERADSILELCMLDELEGADESASKQCYMKAAKIFSKYTSNSIKSIIYNQFGIKNIIYNQFGYVFALLMADHPDAQKEKEELFTLVQLTPGYNIDVFKVLLNDFNREKKLQSILKPRGKDLPELMPKP